MSLCFNCKHKFEKFVTEKGSTFYVATFSKNEIEEEDRSSCSHILQQHQKIPGIIVYQTENSYFYLLRNDDAKIWGKGKGNVDIENSQIFPLLTKKNSKLLSLNQHIDDFWIRRTCNLLKTVEMGKVFYTEIGNKIQEKNLELFNRLMKSGNDSIEKINSSNLTFEEQIANKEKIENVLKISLIHLEICQKLQNYLDQINLLIDEV